MVKSIETINKWKIHFDDKVYSVDALEIGVHLAYKRPKYEVMRSFGRHKKDFINDVDYIAYNDSNPKPQFFTKTGCLKLLKYAKSAPVGMAEEIIKAFDEANRTNIVIDPALPISRLYQEFKTAHIMAVRFGLSGNAAILSANNAVMKLHGHDCIKLFDIPLVASSKDKLLTPTDISWFVKSDAETVNRSLEHLGLQKSNRDKHGNLCWSLTEKGKNYGIYVDTGRVHNSGAMVQQIKWYETVTQLIDEDIQKSKKQ